MRTGIAIELQQGYEAQIRPRSSATKQGVDVALGTIDSDYRGELFVMARSVAKYQFSTVEREEVAGIKTFWRAGDRIAQLVISPILRPAPEWADELTETARGSNGFGSSGL